ncbi:hypothetical protein CEP54_012877 [Fusarium duplospermum]|uniref:Uncharacterized protein n=1 Tax=Fusarium duplospermum TaxID=1325734 RepID=A0A428P668_9HYPO|nr:hypothetical protein CEP54_012877 [Fusarium duplospermum]
MSSLSTSGSQEGTSTGTFSSWLTSSVSGTTPGQPGNTNTNIIPSQSDSTDTATGQPSNTNTIPGSDDSDTIPGPTGTATSGQSGSIETATGTASIPSGGISDTTIPGTETGSTQPGNTETTLPGTDVGPSGTETGPNDTETGTETGPTGTETGTQTGTQTESGTQGTETGPSTVDGTETGVTSIETNSAGTQTGVPGTETGSTGTDTGPTHSDNTETGVSVTQSGPAQPSDTETGSSPATGTETGTETHSVGTQSDPSGTETGSSGTKTGSTQPGNTDTASSGTEGSLTQSTGTETGSATETGSSGTETSSAGTEGSATQSGPTGTESAPSGSETAPAQPSNTETASSGTEAGPSQPTDTETGASGTEPSGTETVSSATESNPAQSSTTESVTSETGPSRTETVSSGTETEPTRPGTTETGTSASTSLTSDAPPTTTSAGVPTTLPPTATTSGQSESYSSTVTVPPENWSPTCASGHPEWTTNTWITTTSEGSTEQTVVPVIVSSKECDDDGSGLILFGFPPVTAVWFKFPGFPGFSFPCIQTFITKCNNPPTSEKDGDDDDDKSSTACSETATASDCLVSCTTITRALDAEITPECTTTCTKTHTGCSVTGVTSTTTEVDGCSATGGGEDCAECSEDLLYTMNGARGRDELEEEPSAVEKRWSKADQNNVAGNKVGNCVMPNGVTVAFPQYPEGNDVFLYEQAIKKAGNSPLRLIDRWYYWDRKKDKNIGCWLTVNGPVPANQYFEGKALPGIDAPNYREKAPSIDHIFEKSFLKDFWWSITPRNGKGQSIRGTTPQKEVQQISCSDLIYYGSALSSPFGSSQPSNAQGIEFITDVFNTYPGAKQNPGGQEHQQVQPLNAQFLDDFIGVDAWTNEAKGFATTPRNIRAEVTAVLGLTFNWQTMSLKQMEDRVNSEIELLDKLFVGVKLANQAHAHEAMVRQNLRVYKALLDMDKNARDCLQDPAVVNNKWSFAERYKSFMESLFTGHQAHSINAAIAQAFADVGPKIQEDLTAALTGMQQKINTNANLTPDQKKKQIETWGIKWASLTQRFVTLRTRYQQAGTTSINVVWDWDIGNIPRKRDEVEEGPSCKVASTTTESATTLSTMVSRSETESDPTSTGQPLTRCENVDECKDWKCDEGKTPTCATVALLPGFKICQCQGDDPSSTTSSAPEPTNTGEGKGCLSNTECEMIECEEGREPTCFHWPFNTDNIFGTCTCRLIPTTTETPTPTTTSTTSTSTTPRQTVTVTAEPEPTPTAYCDVYAAGLFWYVEITRIDGWSDDEGAKLKDEEGGCGAMTGWYWYGETKKWGTSVAFNLPFTIKAGCVERAIVSAGGPKLECDTHPAWEVTDKKLGGDTELAMAAKMLAPDEPAFPDLYEAALEESEEKYGTVTVTDLMYTPVVWSEPTSAATQ